MTVRSETLAAVTDSWQSGREIYARVQCWSRVSIDRMLMDLANEGIVERRSVPFKNGQPKYESCLSGLNMHTLQIGGFDA